LYSASTAVPAARKHGPLSNRIIGVAVAVLATFFTGVGLSPPAQAAGSVWDRVAACESSGNWAIHSGNGFYGGLQFTASTWREFGGARYASHAHRAGKAAQIAIARRVLAVQGPGAWPQCGRRAGLSRANGGRYQVTVSRSSARVALVARGALAVDGQIGPMTIRATQRWLGVAPRGVFGPTTARALQRRLHVRADGVLGAGTIRALQVRIGARRDGARHLNPATVAALQRYLNRH